MIANKGIVKFKIPTCLANGNYFLRHELLALHSTFTSHPGPNTCGWLICLLCFFEISGAGGTNGAQFYASFACFNDGCAKLTPLATADGVRADQHHGRRRCRTEQYRLVPWSLQR